MTANIGTPVAPIGGGGYATTIDVADPTFGHQPGLVIAGSDLAGFFLKLDGVPFRMIDVGMAVPTWALNVNAVTFDNRRPNCAYAYCGNTAQAMLLSIVTDPGTLTAVATPVVSNLATGVSRARYQNTTLAGAKTGGSPQADRRTGAKLVSDLYTTGRVYVGTDNGVQVWDGAGAVTQLAVPGAQVTALVWGPESTSGSVVLYASAIVPSGAPAWSASTAYAVGALASQGGVVYRCIVAHTNHVPPDATYWAPVIGGVYKISGAQATPTVTALPGTTSYATLRGLDAVMESGSVAVYFTDVATANGVFRHNGTTATQLVGYPSVLGAGPVTARRNDDGLATTLYVAHFAATNPNCGRVIRSVDSGAHWTELTNAMVHLTVDGPGSPAWWMTRIDQVLGAGTGHASAWYNSVKIRPDLPSTVVLAGHAGFWGSPNGGDDWYPLAGGAAVSVGHETHIHPLDSTRGIGIDEDWVAIRFGPEGATHLVATGFGGQCGLIAPDLSLVYAQSDRDTNTNGKVWRHADPWNADLATARTRVDITAGLPADRVIGLAARVTAVGHTVLLAVQQGDGTAAGGIWTKDVTAVGWTGAWTRILSKPFGGTTASRTWASIAWPTDDIVYVLAPPDGSPGTVGGLWRTTTLSTAPTTWVRFAPYTPNVRYANGIAVDPAVPTTLYFPSDSTVANSPLGVFRVDNAHDGTLTATPTGFVSAAPTTTTIAATRVFVCTDPGPVAIDPVTGRVYVTTVAVDTVQGGPSVWTAIGPTSPADFVDWSTGADGWKSAITYPQYIAVRGRRVAVANANGSHWSWSMPDPFWPEGTDDDLITLAPDATLEEFRRSLAKSIEWCDRIASVLGADIGGAAQRLATALPKIGGAIAKSVTVPHMTIGRAGTAGKETLRLRELDNAVPAVASHGALPLGYAARYNGTTKLVEFVPSPWRPRSGYGKATTIKSFYQFAPSNSRGVEDYCLYDTSAPAAGTFNVPGGGFGVPSGALAYVDPTNGHDTSGTTGTTLDPYRSIAYAKTRIDAGSTTTTIIVRGDPTGTTETIIRETWPAITGASKVRGVQCERDSRVWMSGSDVLTGWAYVAGKGWQWSGTYSPAIVTATQTNTTLNAVIPDATTTAIQIKNRGAFPASGQFQLAVASTGERMLVIGGQGTGAGTFTVQRGYAGTAAAPVPTIITNDIGYPTPDTDMVFVDGVPYSQVYVPTPAPGEFFVDHVAQRLYIGEPSTWPIATRTVEATMRGYVNGSPTQRHTKAGFFLRGFGFRHYGSDWRNDVYGALMFSGTDQLLEYCTLWYASTSHLNTSQCTRLLLNEVVVANAGGPGMHGFGSSANTFTNLRIRGSNWEDGYPVKPSATERVAGAKITGDVGSTYDNVLVWENHCNGFWHDVHCQNQTMTRFSAIENLGYGYTQENGGGFLGVDWLLERNGNPLYGNRDGFRLAGVFNAQIWNVTSVGNLGAAANFTEYDCTYSSDTAHPAADADQVNTVFRNAVLVSTSESLTAVLYSVNAHFTPPGANLPAGMSVQTPALRTEQMFSPDPYAPDITPQDSDNVWIRLNSTLPYAKWATPTADFTGPPAQYGATTNQTLAQIQARGGTTVKCEARSVGITDATATDAALLDKYFPGHADHDWRWTGSTIPGTATPNLGAVPSDVVCDILGITRGSRAHYGIYNAPRPVSASVPTGPRFFAASSPWNTPIP